MATAPRAGVLAVLMGALIGALLISLVGSAAAGAAPKTIEIKGKGKNVRFEGPRSVRAGKRLAVVNLTRPDRIGPHTFTLVKRTTMPTTRKQQRKCFAGPRRICFRVAVAHELDFETEEIGKPLVEAGAVGWDRPFGKQGKGDSWYTETRGESLTQRVSARRGSTLRFFCAVHPFMQGKIGVR